MDRDIATFSGKGKGYSYRFEFPEDLEYHGSQKDRDHYTNYVTLRLDTNEIPAESLEELTQEAEYLSRMHLMGQMRSNLTLDKKQLVFSVYHNDPQRLFRFFNRFNSKVLERHTPSLDIYGLLDGFLEHYPANGFTSEVLDEEAEYLTPTKQ